MRNVTLRISDMVVSPQNVRKVTLRTSDMEHSSFQKPADKNNRMVASHTFTLFFSITSRQRSAPADLSSSMFDVTIYTGGYDTTLGMRHPDTFKEYADFLRAVNVACAKKHNGLQVDYVYNCTNVGDVKSKRLIAHWGENTNTMRGIIQTQFATKCMGTLHDDLAELSGGPGKKISILMLCRSGKHRSVAAAAMVRYCLSGTRRLHQMRTIHLSGEFWPKRFCTHCRDCCKEAPDRDAIKADVAAIWKDVLAGEAN